MSINQKIVDSRTEYQRHIASVESFIATAESQSSTKNILLSSITRFVSEIKSSISLNDAEKKDILAKMKTSQPLREVYTELRGEKELLTFDELIPEWKNKDGSEVRITSYTVSSISHVLQISDITLDDIHQSMRSFESRDIEPNEDDVQKLKSDFSSLDVSLQTSPEGNAIEQKIHHFVFIVSLKKKSFAEYIEVIKLLDTTKEIDTLIKVSTRLSQAFSKAIAYYTSQEISKTQDGQPIYKNAAAVDMFQLLQKKLTEVLSETVQKRYALIQKDIENTELQESITRLEKLLEVLKIHHISGVLVGTQIAMTLEALKKKQFFIQQKSVIESQKVRCEQEANTLSLLSFIAIYKAGQKAYYDARRAYAGETELLQTIEDDIKLLNEQIISTLSTRFEQKLDSFKTDFEEVKNQKQVIEGIITELEKGNKLFGIVPQEISKPFTDFAVEALETLYNEIEYYTTPQFQEIYPQDRARRVIDLMYISSNIEPIQIRKLELKIGYDIYPELGANQKLEGWQKTQLTEQLFEETFSLSDAEAQQLVIKYISHFIEQLKLDDTDISDFSLRTHLERLLAHYQQDVASYDVEDDDLEKILELFLLKKESKQDPLKLWEEIMKSEGDVSKRVLRYLKVIESLKNTSEEQKQKIITNMMQFLNTLTQSPEDFEEKISLEATAEILSYLYLTSPNPLRVSVLEKKLMYETMGDLNISYYIRAKLSSPRYETIQKSNGYEALVVRTVTKYSEASDCMLNYIRSVLEAYTNVSHKNVYSHGMSMIRSWIEAKYPGIEESEEQEQIHKALLDIRKQFKTKKMEFDVEAYIERLEDFMSELENEDDAISAIEIYTKIQMSLEASEKYDFSVVEGSKKTVEKIKKNALPKLKKILKKQIDELFQVYEKESKSVSESSEELNRIFAHIPDETIDYFSDEIEAFERLKEYRKLLESTLQKLESEAVLLEDEMRDVLKQIFQMRSEEEKNADLSIQVIQALQKTDTNSFSPSAYKAMDLHIVEILGKYDDTEKQILKIRDSLTLLSELLPEDTKLAKVLGILSVTCEKLEKISQVTSGIQSLAISSEALTSTTEVARKIQELLSVHTLDAKGLKIELLQLLGKLGEDTFWKTKTKIIEKI